MWRFGEGGVLGEGIEAPYRFSHILPYESPVVVPEFCPFIRISDLVS